MSVTRANGISRVRSCVLRILRTRSMILVDGVTNCSPDCCYTAPRGKSFQETASDRGRGRGGEEEEAGVSIDIDNAGTAGGAR